MNDSRNTWPTYRRSEVITHERTADDIKQRRGASRTWSRVIRGIEYRFNAVTMPNGERRYYARKFNGYAGGKRFACAWDEVASYTVKPLSRKNI